MNTAKYTAYINNAIVELGMPISNEFKYSQNEFIGLSESQISSVKQKVSLYIKVEEIEQEILDYDKRYSQAEISLFPSKYREAIYITGKKSPTLKGSLMLREESSLRGEELQEFAKKVQNKHEQRNIFMIRKQFEIQKLKEK